MNDIPRMICLAITGVAMASWFGVFAAESALTPPTVDEAVSDVVPERVESASFERWLPALREGAEVTFASRSSKDDELVEPRPFARTVTLGPLVGIDLDACVETMECISRARFDDLRAEPPVTEPGVPYALLHQAELLCGAEEHLAAAEALREGDYFVTHPGQLPPPPPNAGIVQTTAKQNGNRVIVSIVLPFAKHRRFDDAYHYKREIWLNYPASAVDFWNRQDESWRLDATSRVVKATGHRGGQAQALWQRQYAPGGTVVDAQTARLALVQ